MIFGHSQGFIKNCSPWLSSLWAQMVLSEDMFSFRMETRGEQIIENACLYPITFKYIENHGELILKKCLLCPTPEYLWGTIMKNPLLCPNATPQGQPSARAKGDTSPQAQPTDRAQPETSPQARQRSAQARRLTPGRAREYTRKTSQPRRLVDAQHDVHVLDGGAGGAFAEVVEERRDAGLVLVAADDDPQVVGARELVGVDVGR